MDQTTKNTFIDFYKPCSLLLCLICCTALPPLKRSIKSHFQKKHKPTTAELKVITDFYFSINPSVIINDPQSVELPSDYSLPINCLKEFSGYSCNACRYLTINKKNAITHRSQSQHKFNPGETGWKNVTLQTFSRGPHARYWIVNKNDEYDGMVND